MTTNRLDKPTLRLESSRELVIAQLVKQAVDEARVIDDQEGPETAALLVAAIGEGALRELAAGADPFELERGLVQAYRMALDVLRCLSRPTPENGWAPGGGLVFVRALAVLELEEPHFFEDVRAGMHLLRDALAAPARALAKKLGQDPDEVLAQMREGHGAIGLDPKTGAIVDLVAAGITTPAHVLHAALRAAVDAVAALLRAEGRRTRSALTDAPAADDLDRRVRPWQ